MRTRAGDDNSNCAHQNFEKAGFFLFTCHIPLRACDEEKSAFFVLKAYRGSEAGRLVRYTFLRLHEKMY